MLEVVEDILVSFRQFIELARQADTALQAEAHNHSGSSLTPNASGKGLITYRQGRFGIKGHLPIWRICSTMR